MYLSNGLTLLRLC